MSDGIMKYNSGQIQQLVADLTKAHGALGTHRDDAHSAHGALLASWQGGATAPFSAAHNKLINNLNDAIDVLQSGIRGVTSAHENAISTDGGVGQMFNV